ncbi:MAG TPA: PH domain-containing protein [Gaiellaceae bacterium]|jgi:hypothetical protein|nr:PH domain-containing protein [Gaiellaceae bacterium]
MAPPPPDGATVLRSLPWLLLASGLRAFGGTMLILWATVPNPGVGTVGRVVIGVTGVAVLALAGRTLTEGVRVDARGVFVRNIFRSWRLRWDEIEDVGPDKHWFNLSFALRDGRRVPARGYGAVSRPERERLASLLRAARPVAAT